MPSVVRGRWFYLYMILDLYSGKVTVYEVHETESGKQAAALIQRSVIREGCWRQPLVLHADNGAAMKSQTLQMKLYPTGITKRIVTAEYMSRLQKGIVETIKPC